MYLVSILYTEILNFSMVSIWSLTFLYRINFVFAIISWMKIIDQLNAKIKNWDKLPSHSKSFHFYWDECHMQITQSNYNFLSQFCSFSFSPYFFVSLPNITGFVASICHYSSLTTTFWFAEKSKQIGIYQNWSKFTSKFAAQTN